MSTSVNLFEDELDLGLFEDTKFKKKFAKTVSLPEGKSTFRILPVAAGKKPMIEFWYQWFRFVETNELGETKEHWVTGRPHTKDNPVRVKQESVALRKATLQAAYEEQIVGASGQITKKVNEDKMPKDVLEEYKKLKAAERLLRTSRHIFCNAVTLDGQHVVLRLSKTVSDTLKKEIIKLKTEGDTLNPLSLSDDTSVVKGKSAPSFGVWFDFERTGTGLDTVVLVKVRKTRQKVEVNGKFLIDESFDHTPVPEEIKSNYNELCVDLENLIPFYTNEELTLMLKGDKSPVDAKRGFKPKAQTTESSKEETTPGLALSDSEVNQEDDILTLDL